MRRRPLPCAVRRRRERTRHLLEVRYGSSSREPTAASPAVKSPPTELRGPCRSSTTPGHQVNARPAPRDGGLLLARGGGGACVAARRAQIPRERDRAVSSDH